LTATGSLTGVAVDALASFTCTGSLFGRVISFFGNLLNDTAEIAVEALAVFHLHSFLAVCAENI